MGNNHTGSLKTAFETYEAESSALLSTDKGRYVVIRDTEIIGIYDTQLEAYTAGHNELGDNPFLVRQILPADPVAFVAAVLPSLDAGD